LKNPASPGLPKRDRSTGVVSRRTIERRSLTASDRRGAREAKARHQRSAEGRLDHADRNAEYRARQKIVTDTGSDNLAPEACSSVSDDAFASEVEAHAAAAESKDHGTNHGEGFGNFADLRQLCLEGVTS